MKRRHVILIIILIIAADQFIKLWIKSHYSVGEIVRVFGFDWFRIHFIENSGMAWGWKFGNETGKMLLTLLRLAAVVFGTWYLGQLIKKKYTRGFIVCAALIYAGALGNLLDSMFYGMIFDQGLHFNAALNTYESYDGIARFTSHGGYASFLHGSVVDMFYFPIIDSHFPSWIPGIGGQKFEFFAPIFNLADASISVGVIILFIFQKRFFKRNTATEQPAGGETNTEVSDQVQVS